MNLQEKFENNEQEMLKNKKNWDSIGMLAGLDDYQALIIANILENQRLMNESILSQPIWFRRISIPLARRMYAPNRFIGWHLVSIQAMLHPVDIVKLNDEYLEIAAFTKSVKARIEHNTFNSVQEDVNRNLSNRLQQEADAVADLALKITTDLNNEIITDLCNNVSTTTTITSNFWEKIHIFLDAIEKKTGTRPNWIVAGTEVVNELKSHTEEMLAHDEGWWINPVAKLERNLLLIENKLDNRILVGFKGGPTESRYVYASYVPVTLTSVILDPEAFNPQHGVLTRYAKKLNSGINTFGLIKTTKENNNGV